VAQGTKPLGLVLYFSYCCFSRYT